MYSMLATAASPDAHLLAPLCFLKHLSKQCPSIIFIPLIPFLVPLLSVCTRVF